MRLLIGILLLLFTCPAQAMTHGSRAEQVFALLQKQDYSGALHEAELAHSPLLLAYAQWVTLRAPDTGFDFKDLKTFIEAHPDWPESEVLIKRTELAIITSHVDPKEAHAWFTRHPPVTQLGKLAAGDKNETVPPALIREAWVEGNFSTQQETVFLQENGALLQPDDDAARASRLVWEGRYPAALRLLDRLSQPMRLLIQTRIALRTNARSASYDVAQVPANMAGDPGLLFDRISWHNSRDNRQEVRDLLLMAPDEVPYPDKWWPLREVAIRQSIQDKQYSMARRLLSSKGLADSARLQDALWLSGWLYLEFQDQPKEALTEFSEFYRLAQYPHSKTRAAYWAARAAEKVGHTDNAKSLYDVAASYPTTFYGQLARIETGGPLTLPEDAPVTEEGKSRFRRNELVRVVLMLGQMKQTDLARPFIVVLADQATNGAQADLAASLGEELHRPDYSILAAKRAFQNGYLVMKKAYPLPAYASQTQTDTEKALLLGLSRQESGFYTGALSPSGAIGLMQLMPKTAKEVAHKASLHFAPLKLYNGDYNLQLGSLYLERLLTRFDGSYVLAVAAYNAGPGRVDGWTKRFGSPESDYRDTIDWIEKIPFTETRTYVQRVLENTQVYRQLLKPSSPFALREDLER